jgi:cytochrome c biogenesis protein CcmG/thiol:disulfide interchange protein DsbE
MSNFNYEFVGGDGKVYGPFTTAQLEGLVVQGRALDTSQARVVGSGQWQTVDVLLVAFRANATSVEKGETGTSALGSPSQLSDQFKNWVGDSGQQTSTDSSLGQAPCPSTSTSRPVSAHQEGGNTTLAMLSMIFGILSVTVGWFLCCMPGILGLPAVITGHISLSQNRSKPTVYGGVGMAKAGLVLGYISLLFTVGLWIIAILAPDSDISSNGGTRFEQWVDEPAPDFSVTTLDGKEVTLSDLMGRRVIVDFWATWCPPCIKEIPHFIRLANEHDPIELTIIGISDEPESKLRQFAQKEGINYLIASDELNFAPYNKITGIPTTFFIDGDGIIRDIHVGYMNYNEIRAAAFP